MNDDATLLRRYADERSESAFAELVRRHLDLVYSAALRRCGGNPHDAAEVSQQVFTALARQAPALARHAVLTAWLYTATRNHAFNLVRSVHRRQARERDAELMHAFYPDSASDAHWQNLRPVLDEVMDELAELDRTAVLLRFFEKQPFADIGVALNLTEDAARMRVERALEKLHVLLSRRGITSTAAALTTVLAGQSVGAAPAGLAAKISGVAFSAAAKSSAVAKLIVVLRTQTVAKFALVGGAALLATAVVVGIARHRPAGDAARAPTVREVPRPMAAPSEITTPAARATPAAPDRLRALERALSADPGLLQLLRERSRLDVRVNYASWFRELRWTPPQSDAFADFVFAYARQLPAQPNYQPEPDATADPGFARALRLRFGDTVADNFAERQRTIVERRIVESIYGSLAAAGPLTTGQVDQLVAILAGAHRPLHTLMPQFYAERTAAVGFSDPLAALKVLSRYLDAVDWDLVQRRAEAVLAPAHLTLLRALAAKVRASRQLRLAAGTGVPPEAILAQDPAAFAAYLSDVRAGLEFDWARPRRLFDLSDRQVKALKDIKVTTLAHAMERAAGIENTQTGADAEELENEILGNRAPDYREFSRTLASRRYVERLAAIELYGERPLTPAQIERAIAIIVANSERRPDGSIVSAAVNWDAAAAPLADTLSPEPVSLLQHFCRMTQLNHAVDAAIDHAIEIVVVTSRH
jgi:RNA polymerase sigma factor (sigma-70 family)